MRDDRSDGTREGVLVTTATPAGWYSDPDDSTRLRWWDGSRWTDHTQPGSSQPAPSTAAPHPPVAPSTAASDQSALDTQLSTLQSSTVESPKRSRWDPDASRLIGLYLLV